VQCLSTLEPGSGRHGQSHSHRISSVDGGKGTEAVQPSDVCEIKIHGVMFHETVKPPKVYRKQPIGTLTEELVCLLHNSGLWQADTNTAFIFRVQDFYLDEETVFLSETSVCNSLNAQSI
jgi:hypothetical protein